MIEYKYKRRLGYNEITQKQFVDKIRPLKEKMKQLYFYRLYSKCIRVGLVDEDKDADCHTMWKNCI